MLDALLAVGPLAAGAQQVVVHGLEATPDFLLPDRASNIVVIARSSTTVTFRNDGGGTESAFFLAWKVHSIQSRQDQQFARQGGGIAKDLEQAAARWDDLMVPNSAFRIGGTAPAFTNWIGGLYAYAFAEGEQVFFETQFPHTWACNVAGGAVISPHCHLVFPSAAAGNYVFGLEYTVAKIDGVFGAPGAALETAVTASPGVANKHVIVEFPDIDLTAFGEISAMIACRLFRKSGVAGAYADDIVLLEFDWHIQKNDLGSHGEYLK
ncbi:MAG: hypothetical protein WC729_29275 [Sphingomonas sp.]|jgi:hypothetical protein|uniref:hypothetical protein n=1 Tax=Sphingomonas sp. TaxID=28214 RepID=UPI0035649EB6